MKPKAEKRWRALGHNVSSWTSVWNSCFGGPSLGRENNIFFLISHQVVKTGMYLRFKCNMIAANELGTICNTPEDTEHLFLNCSPDPRTWEHFLPLLNKVLLFKVTKTVDLLLFRIFPVKVDRKSYLLALYLLKLILYQIWLARCSHRLHQKLIQSHAIIKHTEVAIKQRITLCFQAHSRASVKQTRTTNWFSNSEQSRNRTNHPPFCLLLLVSLYVRTPQNFMQCFKTVFQTTSLYQCCTSQILKPRL